MSSSSLLVAKQSSGVATLTLNRPDKHNALNRALILELQQALEEIGQDDTVRVISLQANGKHFCAGADLNDMRESATFSQKENIEDASKLARLFQTLAQCSKPTIATIQGACFGGGIGLAACCDIAICDCDASFFFSETKLGLIPAMISPYIVKAIGHRAAKAHFLSAEIFDGPKAYEMGLCYDVVMREGLADRCDKIIHNLLNNGPKALEATKELIQSLESLPIDTVLSEKLATLIATIRASDEGQEGLQAFLNKRAPQWVIPS